MKSDFLICETWDQALIFIFYRPTDKFNSPESEFNEFEPRLKTAKNRFQLSAGLNIEYNFKVNQPYLSRVSNSFNLASGFF